MPGVKKSQRETESIGTQQSSVPLISSHVAVLKMVVYQITLNLQKQNKTKQKQTFVLSYLRCVYVSSFYSWLSFFPSHSVPATMNFFLTLYKTVPQNYHKWLHSKKKCMCILYTLCLAPVNYGASLVAQLVKNPPAMRETWVWSLGWEDPLERRTATHSSILA